MHAAKAVHAAKAMHAAKARRAAACLTSVLVVLVGCTHEGDNTKLVADQTSTTSTPPTTPSTSATLPQGVSPLEHNSTAAGPGGLGARRTVAQEGLTVSLVLERRDGNAGDALRAAVEVAGAWSVTGVRFDFGDGRSSAPTVAGGCPQSRPEPAVFDAGPHPYAKAGDYRVSVSVTASPCAGGEPVTLTTSLTYHRR
jgi:hypothetical protein